MSPRSIDLWKQQKLLLPEGGALASSLESRLKPLPQKLLARVLSVASSIMLVLAAGGCGSAGSRADAEAASATGPDPAAVAGFEQALAALQSGDNAGAQARLEALADAHPDYAGPLVNLAMLRAQRGDVAQAVGLLERAVTVCERCAGPWTELGVLLRQQGRFQEAEQSYLKALAADPDYANAHFNLGILYDLYLAQPELALEHYARFRKLKADDPAVADVDKWMADLARRVKPVERSAQLEGPG